MGVYLVNLVTFNSPSQDYRRNHDYVVRSDALRLSDTAWAAQAEKEADALYHELEPLLQQDDRLCQIKTIFGSRQTAKEERCFH